MPMWRIPINWEMSSILHIEADTLEEAVDAAYDPDIEVPDDGDYMDDSWHVPDIGIEEIREWYNDNQPDGPRGESDVPPMPRSEGLHAVIAPEHAEIFFVNEEEDADDEIDLDPDDIVGFLFEEDEP